ncbi:hypothetical protein [Streptosporangium sp. NBC_01756]|uniref:hypothetical protein n=1 Tax=Streptosporangium sp. NBC_01756 TaxID=2975950 RepID=UPI002DDA1C15|nr:hypothetical protein [Streptosporangium sp. NBC_01756]WSC90260.1 hypothetical protein OIE48_19390 [Streptosporangium sp. NBC_01756]
MPPSTPACSITCGRFPIRTGNAPRNMAALRNLAIGALHLTGATNLAQAIRHLSRDATRLLTVLGLI